jgi:hypothetical protein
MLEELMKFPFLLAFLAATPAMGQDLTPPETTFVLLQQVCLFPGYDYTADPLPYPFVGEGAVELGDEVAVASSGGSLKAKAWGVYEYAPGRYAYLVTKSVSASLDGRSIARCTVTAGPDVDALDFVAVFEGRMQPFLTAIPDIAQPEMMAFSYVVDTGWAAQHIQMIAPWPEELAPYGVTIDVKHFLPD